MWLDWFLLTLVIAIPLMLLAAILHYRQQVEDQKLLDAWARRIGLDEHAMTETLGSSVFEKQWRQWSWVQRIKLALQLAGFYQEAYLKAFIQLQLAAILGGIWFILIGDMSGVVLGLVTMGMPYLALKTLQLRYRKRLSKQFPQMLESLVRTLHAGHSVDTAIGQLVESTSEPLRHNLRQLSNQLQVGASFKDALLRFSAITPVPEARFFVATLIIQRETGGAIVPILERLSAMLHRRETFEGKVRVLTAETRFTANFLTLVPIAYIGYKYLFDPESMRFYLEDPTGKTLFAIAVGLVLAGTVVINRMMRLTI